MIKNKRGSAKNKILATADKLFYKQGYSYTGIQQIIDEAGVSKTTFYVHFKSKEELGVTYLKDRHHNDIELFKDGINNAKKPYDRFMSLVKGLNEWQTAVDFRGCGFQNIIPEITDGKHPMRKVVRHHNDEIRTILRSLCKDLIESDHKYEHLNVNELVDKYYLILEGAIIASQNYREDWPFKMAVKAVKDILR